MIIQIKFKLKRPFPGKFIEKYPFYGIIYVRSLQKTPKKVKFLTSSKKKVWKIPILRDYLCQKPPEDTQKSQIFNVIQEKSLLTKNVYFYI